MNLLYFSLLRRSSDGVGNKCDANVMQMFCYDDEKPCFKCIVFHVLQNAVHKESDNSL